MLASWEARPFPGEFGRAKQPDHHGLQLQHQYRQESSHEGRGGFCYLAHDVDDLPSNAQSFLTNYRTRLEMMSEAEFTALAVREVYSAYYSEMGGVGAAPEPKARTPTTEGKVVRFQRRPKPQPASSAARNSTGPMIRKSLPALLIFASTMALIVTYRFLMQ